MRDSLEELTEEGRRIESQRFEGLLCNSGYMDQKAARKWLEDPTATITQAAGRLMTSAINLQAIRAMASEEAGYALDDKEWAKVSQEAKWIKCANARNMGHALAAQRATHIFDLLSQGSHQQALDYMAYTIMERAQGSRRPNRAAERRGKRNQEQNKKKQ